MGFVPRRDQPPNRGRCSSFDEEGLTSPFPTLVSVLLYLLDNTSPVSSLALISRITLLAKRCDRSVYIVNKTITLRTREISKLRHRTFLTKSRCHLSLRYRRTSQELTKLTTVGTLVICFATLSGARRIYEDELFTRSSSCARELRTLTTHDNAELKNSQGWLEQLRIQQRFHRLQRFGGLGRLGSPSWP
ncbi:hypothetical protein Anapl_00031 [Anas platyrhynchos]|uniref:Uncharacterized protein n=1 Tax=Anas platyrhynchos TaxID=8839 RepID=R0K2M2_ANAPL|nr:hypothetical protein Anapl_00031 [Anas platyrhynchos]